MKYIVTIFFTVLCWSGPVPLCFAQQFQWLTGGGSDMFLQNGAVDGEWITHMCTDDHGNVYSLAQVGPRNIKADTFFQNAVHPSSNRWHILLMSHDCNGNMRFAKLLQSYSTNFCHGLAYHNGMVYMAGTLWGTDRKVGYDAALPDGYQYSFTAKFDTSGNYYWTRFIGPDSLFTTQVTFGDGALAIDGQGNIHRYTTAPADYQLTPAYRTSQWGNYDLKYDPNGNLLNVIRLQDIDSGYLLSHVEIEKSTNKMYVLFKYKDGTVTRSYNALAGYNTNGTQIWKDTTNPGGGLNSFTISNGAIYFTGVTSQVYPFTIKGMTVNNSISPTGHIAVIGKLNINNGNPQWMYHVDGTNGVNGLGGITVLPDNSIAAFGVYAGFKIYRNDTVGMPMGGNYRPMLFVIDTTGFLIDWTWMVGTDFYNSGRCITSDKKGNIYAGGYLSLALQAGNLPSYTTNGDSDFFITKFGYDCNCTGMANPTSAFTYTITDSLKKEVQFTFTGTNPHDSVVWRFGDASVLTQTNPTHIFADTGVYTVCAKVMVPCGRKVICQDIYIPYIDTTTDTADNIQVVNALEHVRIYPNPANDVLHVDGLDPGSRIELYDIVGRKAHMIISAKENEVVNLSYLSSGNYIIHITDSEGRRMTGKVVKR